jgi:hypothetical protein
MEGETLTMLLRGEYINMPERIQRGIWPHPPLSFSRVFSSAKDAARYFLKWDLHLPGDLDGWKVIE